MPDPQGTARPHWTHCSSIPTFLRAMLRWHSARLCRSCWPRASRSSSRWLSRSSCWNSRSSNSLASVSSASASFEHTRALSVDQSHWMGTSTSCRQVSHSKTSCHASISYSCWPGTRATGQACPLCPLWAGRQFCLLQSTRNTRDTDRSVCHQKKAMEAPRTGEDRAVTPMR